MRYRVLSLNTVLQHRIMMLMTQFRNDLKYEADFRGQLVIPKLMLSFFTRIVLLIYQHIL